MQLRLPKGLLRAKFIPSLGSVICFLREPRHRNDATFRGLPFVAFQQRKFHLRPTCVRPIHGFAVVSEIFLGKTFRVGSTRNPSFRAVEVFTVFLKTQRVFRLVAIPRI